MTGKGDTEKLWAENGLRGKKQGLDTAGIEGEAVKFPQTLAGRITPSDLRLSATETSYEIAGTSARSALH
jgi:hypothetical protein